MSNVKELEVMLQDAKQKLSINRTKQEAVFKAIQDKAVAASKYIPGLDQTLRVGTLEDFVPELYKERPDMEAYKAQLERLNMVIQATNAVIVTHNQNVIKKLTESNEVTNDVMALKQQLSDLKEQFLSNRAKQELIVANWVKKISQIPKDIIAPYEVTEDMTLKSFIPSYYDESATNEQREAEYNDFIKMLEGIRKIETDYNKEAEECLLEYQQFALGVQSVNS